MCSNAERVEIYSSIQHRMRYSVDETLRMAQEASKPGMTLPCVARQPGISLPVISVEAAYGRGREGSDQSR